MSIKTILSLLVTAAMLIYYILCIIVIAPNAADVLSEIMVSPSQQIILETPTGIVNGIDYGVPIRPTKPLPNGSSTIMIITTGAAGQILGFVQVFFSKNDELYGPYITDQNGLLIIQKIKEGNYTIAGFYKGYSVRKIISVPNKEERLYNLSFPVFIELFEIPLDFNAFVAFIVGLILLLIVIVIMINEYLNWRKIQLERRSRERPDSWFWRAWRNP